MAENFVSRIFSETIGGIKRFLQFPYTPEDVPTEDYHVANKQYVDTKTTRAITGDTTMTVTDRLLMIDDSASSLSIALVTASCNIDREIFITNKTGNNCVYIRDGESGDVLSTKLALTVTTTLALSNFMETFHLVSDGSNWFDLNCHQG